MARMTWTEIKAEAILESKNRSDTATRMEGWLRKAYLETAYGYRFHELEKKVAFSLISVSEKTFIALGITDLKFIQSLRDSTNKRRIVPATFRYIDNLADNVTIPRYYCRYADSLLFDGTPSTSIDYYLRYKRKIGEPVYAGTTYPETPEEWDEVIMLLGVSRAYEALHEPDNANRIESRIQRIIARFPVEEEVDAEDDTATIQLRTS